MRNKPPKTALEFSRLQSIFSAIIMLNNQTNGGAEGDVANLLEIGEDYAGILCQRHDNLAKAKEVKRKIKLQEADKNRRVATNG